MPDIVKIHGFQRAGTSFSSETSRFIVEEVVLVEAETPLITLYELTAALPSFLSGPGTVAFNPLQLTFTLNQSTHPESDLFYLESVSQLRRIDEGVFWEVPLRYASAAPQNLVPSVTLSGGSVERRDQKVKKPDSKVKAKKQPIIDPTDREPIFSGSSKLTTRTTRFDYDGNLIYHTNLLPITEGISLPVVVRNWSWTWNVLAETYNHAEYDDLENHCNSVEFTIKQGIASYAIEAETMKCMGFSVREFYENPAGSTKEFHCVALTATFELHEILDKWTQPPISMHTKQLIIGGGGALDEIEINARGNKATEPWPLKPNGAAIAFADLPTAVPADFGVLQAGGADFIPCKTFNFIPFFTKHKLKLPHKND